MRDEAVRSVRNRAERPRGRVGAPGRLPAAILRPPRCVERPGVWCGDRTVSRGPAEQPGGESRGDRRDRTGDHHRSADVARAPGRVRLWRDPGPPPRPWPGARAGWLRDRGRARPRRPDGRRAPRMKVDFRRGQQPPADASQIASRDGLRRLCHVPEVNERGDRYNDPAASLGIGERSRGPVGQAVRALHVQTMACESATTLTKSRRGRVAPARWRAQTHPSRGRVGRAVSRRDQWSPQLAGWPQRREGECPAEAPGARAVRPGCSRLGHHEFLLHGRVNGTHVPIVGRDPPGKR